MKKLSNKAKVEAIKKVLEDRLPNGTVYDLPLILKEICKITYDITPEDIEKFKQLNK